MLNVGFSEVGDVSVVTSSHSGLSVDHWADRATDKIISVGSNSDPILVEQAKAYRETIKQVIQVIYSLIFLVHLVMQTAISDLIYEK